LELKEILGTGAYGVVYSALDHCTGIWYAVKAFEQNEPKWRALRSQTEGVPIKGDSAPLRGFSTS